MSNKKPVGSLSGAVICGAITAFCVLVAISPQGAGDALVPMFAFLYGLLSGIGCLIFLLIWAVKKRKYANEK